MFCTKCGTENRNEAKYCFNCGEELSESKSHCEEKGETKELLELQKEFEEQIIKKLMDAYLATEEVTITQFYGKAECYNMNSEQIEKVEAGFNDKIEKINNFIKKMYEETLTLALSDEQKDELNHYIGLLGFDEYSNEILDKYDIDNGIIKKREFLKNVISTYRKKGKIPEYKISKKNNTEFVKKRYKNIKSRILEYEKEIEKSCNDKVDFSYDYSLGQELIKYGQKLGFSPEESSDIMFGFRDKSGVEERQRIREAQENKERILRKINQKFPSKTYVLLEGNLKFDSKFFVRNFINEQLNAVTEQTVGENEKIVTLSDNVLLDIANMLDKFAVNAKQRIMSIEQVLGLEEHKELYKELDAFIGEKAENLQAAQIAFYKIDAGVDAESAYRQARKSMRGKWEGGGFGFSGAVKGAVMAGAMNLGTGAVHSVVNGLGNIKSSFKASGDKERIARSIKKDIAQNVERLIENAKKIIIDDLVFNYPECIWIEDIYREQEVASTLINAEETDQKLMARELLLLNPFKIEYYLKVYSIIEQIETDDIVEKDLNTLVNIADQFKIDFSETLVKLMYQKLEHLTVEKETLCQISNLENVLFSQGADRKKFEDKLYRAIINAIGDLQLENGQDKIQALKEWNQEFPNNCFQERYQEEINKEIEDIRKSLKADAEEEALPKADKLFAKKGFVSSKCALDIDAIVVECILHKVSEWIEETDFNNQEDVLLLYDQAKKLDEKYEKTEGRDKVKIEINEYITSMIHAAEFGYQITVLVNNIVTICDRTGLNFRSRDKEIQVALENLRTVYDYMTDYKFGVRTKSTLVLKNVGERFENVEEADSFRKKVKEIEALYQKCDIRDESSIKKTRSDLQKVYEQTQYGLDIMKEMDSRLQCLDVEKRTVLGVLYTTREEAEKERRKVVGNRKFATEEEAAQEKERQRKDQELINFEGEQISNLESQNLSPVKILAEIKKKKFKSKPAKDRERAYEKEILKTYKQLKAEEISETVIKERTKMLVLGGVGIIAFLGGIGPFFAMGWVAKIIIGCIILVPWGNALEAKEALERLSEKHKKLIEIEKTFIIHDQQIELR